MSGMILGVHIAAGLAALLAAGAALGARKGGALHRGAGRVFVLAMLAVTLTTLALVALRPNLFLFLVGIFSFHLVFTGWRAGALRDGRPRALDHVAGGAMALAAGAMLGLGGASLLGGDLLGGGGSRPVVLIVFGAIGLALALSDWRGWRAGPVQGRARIARHLTRMLAGTVAAITAAGVVNLGGLPELVLWLGPTLVMTPVILWWTLRTLRPAR